MEGSLSDRAWQSMQGVVDDRLLAGIQHMGYE